MSRIYVAVRRAALGGRCVRLYPMKRGQSAGASDASDVCWLQHPLPPEYHVASKREKSGLTETSQARYVLQRCYCEVKYDMYVLQVLHLWSSTTWSRTTSVPHSDGDTFSSRRSSISPGSTHPQRPRLLSSLLRSRGISPSYRA